jgi:hypothetical protein
MRHPRRRTLATVLLLPPFLLALATPALAHDGATTGTAGASPWGSSPTTAAGCTSQAATTARGRGPLPTPLGPRRPPRPARRAARAGRGCRLPQRHRHRPGRRGLRHRLDLAADLPDRPRGRRLAGDRVGRAARARCGGAGHRLRPERHRGGPRRPVARGQEGVHDRGRRPAAAAAGGQSVRRDPAVPGLRGGRAALPSRRPTLDRTPPTAAGSRPSVVLRQQQAARNRMPYSCRRSAGSRDTPGRHGGLAARSPPA